MHRSILHTPLRPCVAWPSHRCAHARYRVDVQQTSTARTVAHALPSDMPSSQEASDHPSCPDLSWVPTLAPLLPCSPHPQGCWLGSRWLLWPQISARAQVDLAPGPEFLWGGFNLSLPDTSELTAHFLQTHPRLPPTQTPEVYLPECVGSISEPYGQNAFTKSHVGAHHR